MLELKFLDKDKRDKAASEAFSFGKIISLNPFSIAISAKEREPLIGRNFPSKANSPKNNLSFELKHN